MVTSEFKGTRVIGFIVGFVIGDFFFVGFTSAEFFGEFFVHFGFVFLQNFVALEHVAASLLAETFSGPEFINFGLDGFVWQD